MSASTGIASCVTPVFATATSSMDTDRGMTAPSGTVLSSIGLALDHIAAGKMIVVVDDEARENEGDIVMAAEAATPEAINLMIRHSRGLVCAPMPGSRLDELRLPLMVQDNTDVLRTAFTVSVDYKQGSTTGISAADRAATLRALVNPQTQATDFNRPGHIFPLRAAPLGVLARPGHTEAAVDLTRLAGLTPGGVICEIIDDDGTMSRLPRLMEFARRHGMPIVSIADLIRHRIRTETFVHRVSEARLPTRYGTFTATTFQSALDGRQHLALTMGEIGAGEDVLTRVHSECLTGDLLGSLRCDCGEQLHMALARIGAEGRGCLVYLRGHEGRGVGLARKIEAYALQDAGGHDTLSANIALGLPADARDYSAGAQILADLDVRSIRLLTNNPGKATALADLGVRINSNVPIIGEVNEENMRYLAAKKDRMGHML
jgi:3,4-dihydroxy 2-butanone 4-phosphate synthase/GTP cyclohydrolase II